MKGPQVPSKGQQLLKFQLPNEIVCWLSNYSKFKPRAPANATPVGAFEGPIIENEAHNRFRSSI